MVRNRDGHLVRVCILIQTLVLSVFGCDSLPIDREDLAGAHGRKAVAVHFRDETPLSLLSISDVNDVSFPETVVSYGRWKHVSSAGPAESAIRSRLAASLDAVRRGFIHSNTPGAADNLRDVEDRLLALANNQLIITKIAIEGPATSVDILVKSLEVYFTVEVETLDLAGALTGRLTTENDASAIEQVGSGLTSDQADGISDKGIDTDWHPLGGTITWSENGANSGFLLKFWFDERALDHYASNLDAYEIGFVVPKSCYTTDGVTSEYHSNLDMDSDDKLNLCSYIDKFNSIPFLDDSTKLNVAVGTGYAAQLKPGFGYYAWYPMKRKQGDCVIENAALRVNSQPSISSTPGSLLPPCWRGAASIFSRSLSSGNNYFISETYPVDIPADDPSNTIQYFPGRLPSDTEIQWARNLCALPNDASWSEGVVPDCVPHVEVSPSAIVAGSGDSIFETGSGFNPFGQPYCKAKNAWGTQGFSVSSNQDGMFEKIYTPGAGAGLGKYDFWCIDDATLRESNHVEFTLLAPGCSGPLSKACGNCGTQYRTCDNGSLSTWGVCEDQGVCFPGTSQVCSSGGLSGSKTCSSSCSWGACETSADGGTCPGATGWAVVKVTGSDALWAVEKQCAHRIWSLPSFQALGSPLTVGITQSKFDGCYEICRSIDGDDDPLLKTPDKSAIYMFVGGVVRGFADPEAYCACSGVWCGDTPDYSPVFHFATYELLDLLGPKTETFCAPGSETPCGQGGSSLCSSECEWDDCLGQTCPDQLSEPCGNCGYKYRTCNNGVVSGWGPCQGEGPCSPIETRGCPGGGIQNCSASCSWEPCDCVPNCQGRVCGDNGCGNTCGTCGTGTTCNASGQCVCSNDCTSSGAKECVDSTHYRTCGYYDADGCLEWSATLSCTAGTTCSGGTCACTPNCTGKSCGDDGCGGSCGTCGIGTTCNSSWQCIANFCAVTYPNGCKPFKVTVPSGTPVSTIWWWNDSDSQPLIAQTFVGSSGGVFDSPVGACAATVDYPGRWDSWTAGTFPSGAPSGSCVLCSTGKTVSFCGLPKGDSAWGCAYNGDCKTCFSNCAGKACGGDGCGGTCGTCAAGTTCNTSGQCESVGCLDQVKAGKVACVDPNGRIYISHKTMSLLGQVISDQDIASGKWVLPLWFELAIPPGQSNWWLLMPLALKETGVSYAQLPALPTGLCAQQTGVHRHPYRLGSLMLSGMDIHDPGIWASQSNVPGAYQDGLIAVLPDQTYQLPDPPYNSIAVANSASGYYPAGKAAHDDMYGTQLYCTP